MECDQETRIARVDFALNIALASLVLLVNFFSVDARLVLNPEPVFVTLFRPE